MDITGKENLNLNSWIYQYYVEPIVADSGYNPVNTITWALLLGLFLLLILRLFRRLDVRIDDELIVYTVPYILAGSTLRVIEDAELLAAPAKYLLITPLIYILVGTLTVISLLATRKAFHGSFVGNRAFGAIGLVWTAANLVVLLQAGLARPWVPAAVLLLGTAVTLALYLAVSATGLRFLRDRINLAILYAHMLDASSTFVGIDFLGYHEKHVVPTYLINLAGTAVVMYPLKLAVLLPVLAAINEVLKDEPSGKSLTKLALLTLGLAPAIRNSLRMAMGI